MENTFSIQNEQFEQRTRRRSIIATLAIHGLLLALCALWIAIKTPIPPFEGGGVEVNFGISVEGSGDVQPMSDNPNLAATATSAPAPQKTASTPDENIITQNTEDAPTVITHDDHDTKKTEVVKLPKTVVSTSTAKSTTTEPVKTPEPTVNQNAIYHGPKGKPNNSTGDGPDKVPGDKGKLGGDPYSKNYTGDPGSGGGTGGGDFGNPVKFNLGGRKMLHKPGIDDKSQKAGTVVVRITVDNTGSVVQATYTQIGSTTSDDELIAKAVAAAKAAKFNPSDIAEQKGTMTINFRLK